MRDISLAPIDAVNFCPCPRRSENLTPFGKQKFEPLSPYSKCALAAFIVVGIAAFIFIALSSSKTIGFDDKIIFISCLSGGGALAALSVGGIVWHVIKKYASSKQILALPYSDRGQRAIACARQKLEQRQDLQPMIFKFRGLLSFSQPFDKEIARLAALHQEVYEAFVQKIKDNEDPWNDPSTLEMADDLMKLSYAISSLSLDELPRLAQKKKGSGNAVILTSAETYQYRTFFYLPTAYHSARRKVDRSENNPEVIVFSTKIEEKYLEPFYQEGTLQWEWRMLYNDYCERVRMCLDEDELKKKDSRYVKWTQADESKETFITEVGKQPT